MKPDTNDMKRFKRFFADKQSVIYQIYSKHKDRRHLSEVVEGPLTDAKLEQLVEANTDNKMEISLTINRCDGGRKAANVQEIVALFIDSDDGKYDKNSLLALPIAPHMVVQTSAKNFHAYWRIHDCPVAQFKPVQTALAHRLKTDDQVCDPNRAMRMAGTLNWKRDKPYRAKIVHRIEDAQPIPLSVFLEKMKLRMGDAPSPPKTSVQPRPKKATDSPNLPDLHARIRRALDGVPADDRSVWFRFGMAIHSVDSSEAGYKLWRTWSRTSNKFNEQDQRKTWEAFKPHGGIHIETLFYLANRLKRDSSVDFDEMTLTEMFTQSVRDVLRYDRESRTWLQFDGVAWRDDSQAPLRMVRQFILGLSQSERGMLTDAVKRFRTAGAMRAIVSQAELDEEIHISLHAFDRDPYLMAVENGVVDLRTGTFRKAVAGDYLRRKAAVTYDASADCPVWKRFMRDIVCGDKELYRYKKRALGYTLYGSANLQVFFVALGSGGNGKGTLTHTIQKVLGEYAISVAPNLLTSAYSGNANAATPALVKLHGARMVACSELPNDRRFDEAFIKQFAGGDEITARSNYGDVFSFQPEGKLWLSANDLPEIRANDEAMWRRLIPLPFNARFQGKDRDDDLEKKFVAEYPGIFNWLLAGAKEFGESGLGTCAAVETLKQSMRRDADSVLAWLADRCVKKEKVETASSIAYEDYLDFMRKRRRKAVNASEFRASLEEKGFPPKRRSVGNFFIGFQLRQ